MNAKVNEHARERGGWPAWKQQADEILDSIRAHVFQPGAIGILALGQSILLRGDNYNDVVFAEFVELFDRFLSQFIQWVEQKELGELHEWAGQAFADRLQFLSAQQRDWSIKNERFGERQPSDRRHARTPLSYLGWLSGDYLYALIAERRAADLLLLREPGRTGNSKTFAELLNYSEQHISWLSKLKALPDFSRESALQWAKIVFERMRKDEERILRSPEMQKRKTRDSKERRGSRKIRLYDFKRTIVGAVSTLAAKPVGRVRGITRPM